MKRVLIVDDDEDVAEVTSLILSNAGFETAYLLDGNLVAQTVAAFDPNLIILDLRIADIDGRAVCKAIRATSTTRLIPILMFSASPGVEISILEAGANVFLAKPFDSAQLIDLACTLTA